MNNKPKVLFWDIESSPNISYTWGLWQQDVIAFQKEWELLSFAYKFQGDSKVKCLARCDFNDKTEVSLVKALHKVLSSCDISVAHNGKSFDEKKANAKFLEHGLVPVKPFASVDTKLVAKNLFNLNSNALNAIGKLLKLGEKVKHQGIELWLACMADDLKAWKLMKKYNTGDIILLEKVYNRMVPFMRNHPNMALLQGKAAGDGCNKCGSTDIVKDGIRANSMSLNQQFKCKACKGYFLRPLKKVKV